MTGRYELRTYKTGPVVLVWCYMCDKFISEEIHHHCRLPETYKIRREVMRKRKEREGKKW